MILFDGGEAAEADEDDEAFILVMRSFLSIVLKAFKNRYMIWSRFYKSFNEGFLKFFVLVVFLFYLVFEILEVILKTRVYLVIIFIANLIERKLIVY